MTILDQIINIMVSVSARLKLMVLANKITIGRFVLIPMVIGSILLYGHGVEEGVPVDAYRWLAIVFFLMAAGSDILDGYVARHHDQHTRFGELIDPLADKCLLSSTILVLTFTPWAWTFPIWFPCLVIIRDALSVGGAFLVNRLTGGVEMKAHWAGKGATLFQVVAVFWVMTGILTPHPIWVTIIASAFILVAALVYVNSAFRQIVGRKVPSSTTTQSNAS